MSLRNTLYSLLASFLIVATVGLLIYNTTLVTAQSNEPTVVAFGDSLSTGVGTDETWVDMLSDWTGINIINRSVSGDTIAEARDRVDSINALDPDIVFVFLGGNDILQNVPISESEEDLERLVDDLQDEGAEVIIMGIQRSRFDSARERMYERVADATNARFVENVYGGIFGRSFFYNDILDDPVHPNENGHEVFSERTWPEFQDALIDLNNNYALTAHCRLDYFDETDRDNRINQSQTVTWRSYTWGGDVNSENEYRYRWLDEDGDTVDDDTVLSGDLEDYDEGDNVRFRFRVTDGDDTVTTNCPGVVVTVNPLAAACSVTVYSDEQEIVWKAKAAGGSGNIDFNWTSTSPDATFSRDNAEVQFRYASSGMKRARLTVTSDSQTVTLNCAGEIAPDEDFRDNNGDDLKPLSGYCDATQYRYGRDYIDLQAGAKDDERPYEYEWEIGGRTSTVKNPRYNFDNPGTKTFDLNVESQNQDIDLICQAEVVAFGSTSGGGSGGGNNGEGCFIATAAYGTSSTEGLKVLRDFRDNTLLETKAGTAFVKTYYTLSPPAANFIAEHELLRGAVRHGLVNPLVKVVDTFNLDQ